MSRRARRRWSFLSRWAPKRAKTEIRAELELYLEQRIEELCDEGMPRHLAEEQAYAAFGDVDAVLGQCLRVVGRARVGRLWEGTLGSLIRDLQYAARTLRRSPRFVAAVVLTLALGIGANSAIFSVLNAVALRPLPYPEAERLYRLWTQYPEQGDLEFAVSNAEYLDFAVETELFESIGAFASGSQVMTDNGPPRRLSVVGLSTPIWELLGAKPLLGRTFTNDEDHPDAPRVALLSESAWRSVYGADGNVLGRPLQLDGRTYTLLGVMPGDFFLPQVNADVFVPLRLAADRIVRRDGHYLTVIGRARDGVGLGELRAEVEVVSERWMATYEHAHPMDVEPLRDDVGGDAGTPLALLLAAVGCVLLIGCANVAGLMMARAVDRQREVALRHALGASRRRIARLLILEGLVLSGIGGLLGLTLAAAGLPALLAMEPGDLPRLREIGLDGSVLVFTLLLSTVLGLLFATVPALRVAAVDPSAMLAGGRATGDISRQRFLRGLVAAEVATALVLVVGAGLSGRPADPYPGLESQHRGRVGRAPRCRRGRGRAIVNQALARQHFGAEDSGTRTGAR